MAEDKEKQEPEKKRSKKHEETKLAIKGDLDSVIKASFLKANKVKSFGK